jgi:mannose-1-phosphate guanylyltransferase
VRRRNFAPRTSAQFLPSLHTPHRYQDRYGVKITCSQETEPLGTAGPIALAQPLLDDGEPFFVMNCDVACHFSMKGLLDFHRAHGKVGTIMVTRVEEPAKYGKSVVLSHETGLIDRFVEHGRTYHGNWINAGVYIFSPSIFERIALRPTSMEREVLPELAADDQLYSRQLDGFWMNVKKPREWIEGNALYLSHLRTERPAALLAAGGGDGGDGGSSSGGGDSGKSPALGASSAVEGNVLMDASATVGDDCLIGPDVTIGPNCVIGSGVRLAHCVLLEGVKVGAHACVFDSILGWRATVGEWTRVEGVSVLGEDVHLGSEVCLNGALILPHKKLDTSVTTPQIIM